MHENRETSRASIEKIDRSAKARSHNADVHAPGGVGLRRSTDEAAEQRGATFGGDGGGKAADGRLRWGGHTDKSAFRSGVQTLLQVAFKSP